ncbi:MAG: hypothetical protein ACR2JO_08550 [Mycobacteriales bacterium]
MTVVGGPLGQDHHTLRRVIEIGSSHDAQRTGNLRQTMQSPWRIRAHCGFVAAGHLPLPGQAGAAASTGGTGWGLGSARHGGLRRAVSG